MALAVQATELFVVLVWEKELGKGGFTLITYGSPHSVRGTHPGGYTSPKDLTDPGVGAFYWEE